MAMENWTDILHTGDAVDVLYVDFKEAFDSVPYARLLKKLDAYGIKGKLWNWIKAFITNHKQRVCVNGLPSSWSNVISGIPQGSVFGPLFFIIHVNDFSSNLRNFALHFADDTKI